MKRSREPSKASTFFSKRVRCATGGPTPPFNLFGNEDTVQYVLAPLLDLPTLCSLARTNQALARCCHVPIHQYVSRSRFRVLEETSELGYLDLFLWFAQEDASDLDRWYTKRPCIWRTSHLFSLWKKALAGGRTELLDPLRLSLGVNRVYHGMEDVIQDMCANAAHLLVKYCADRTVIEAFYLECKLLYSEGNLISQVIAHLPRTGPKGPNTNYALAQYLVGVPKFTKRINVLANALDNSVLTPVGKVFVAHAEQFLSNPKLAEKVDTDIWINMMDSVFIHHWMKPWAFAVYHAILPFFDNKGNLLTSWSEHMMLYNKLSETRQPLYMVPWLKHHHVPSFHCLHNYPYLRRADVLPGLLRVTLPSLLPALIQEMEVAKRIPVSTWFCAALRGTSISEATWKTLYNTLPEEKFMPTREYFSSSSSPLLPLCPETMYNFFKAVPLELLAQSDIAEAVSKMFVTRITLDDVFGHTAELIALMSMEEMKERAASLLPLLTPYFPPKVLPARLDSYRAILQRVINTPPAEFMDATFCKTAKPLINHFQVLMAQRLITEYGNVSNRWDPMQKDLRIFLRSTSRKSKCKDIM